MALTIEGSVLLELHHWYTCFEAYNSRSCHGTFFTACPDNATPAREVAAGPVSLASHILLINASTTDTVNPKPSNNVTTCESSQQGVDDLTQTGAWWEPDANSVTEKAYWAPNCTAPSSEGTIYTAIGDSTMPNPTRKTGYVHDGDVLEWVTDITNVSSYLSKSTANDVLLFQGGMHQLFHGFRASVSAEIVILMLCQLATSFKGKIIVLGPNPVQQHLFQTVDMRNGQMRHVNALLRKRIVQEHGGSLMKVCRSISFPLDTLRIAVRPLSGVVETDKTAFNATLHHWWSRPKRPLHNFTKLEEFPGSEQAEFIEKMRNVNPVVTFGNRTVWFTDLQTFLLSRDDTYRDNDKLHDLRGDFFWTTHASMMNQLATMRSQGEL